MNREIKFRGKRLSTREWVYGSLIQWKDGDATICANESENNNVLIKHDVNPDTVGQYTGLKDRSGQDVYEGDLLRTSEGNIMIAEWVGSGIITRCLTPTYDGMMNTNRYAFPVSEKIGNIYDNPDLLEDGK